MLSPLFSGIRHPEELSVMKKFDKDDLKKNIKENLNQKKKKKDSKVEDSLSVNGNGTMHGHNSQNSLDRLSPYNRSPMGPSPSVSIVHLVSSQCLCRCSSSVLQILV